MPIRHITLASDHDIAVYSVVDQIAAAFSVPSLQELGSGCFSTVYQHPVYQDKVIKVLRYRDPGYTAFIRATVRLQDKGAPCPWLPHVYEATMFHVFHPLSRDLLRHRAFAQVLVVVLDKLIGWNNGQLTDEQQDILQGLRDERIWGFDVVVTRFAFLAQCKAAVHQLRRAARILRLIQAKAKVICDLHYGNAMFSPVTGQLVITDPFA